MTPVRAQRRCVPSTEERVTWVVRELVLRESTEPLVDTHENFFAGTAAARDPRE
jgi:hypothetical protein